MSVAPSRRARLISIAEAAGSLQAAMAPHSRLPWTSGFRAGSNSKRPALLQIKRELLSFGQRYLERVERHRDQPVVADDADQIDHAGLAQLLLRVFERCARHAPRGQQFGRKIVDRLLVGLRELRRRTRAD